MKLEAQIYEETNNPTILKNFQIILPYIKLIKYFAISVEIFCNSSFFFNILVNDEIKIHIEVYFDDLNTCFVNVYRDRKPVFCGYMQVKNIGEFINDNFSI